MKGMVYTLLQEMVEETFGFECWDKMVSSCDLASGGIYTSAEVYDDAEILSLVGSLSEQTGTAVPDLVEAFGVYLFPHLVHSLPPKMMDYPDLWSFLSAVHDVIHVEVKKLHQGALTPDILVTDQSAGSVTIKYQSPRKMCFLALGLIHKAAEHFDSKVEIKHQCCMHEGNDHCSLLVNKLS